MSLMNVEAVSEDCHMFHWEIGRVSGDEHLTVMSCALGGKVAGVVAWIRFSSSNTVSARHCKPQVVCYVALECRGCFFFFDLCSDVFHSLLVLTKDGHCQVVALGRWSKAPPLEARGRSAFFRKTDVFDKNVQICSV